MKSAVCERKSKCDDSRTFSQWGLHKSDRHRDCASASGCSLFLREFPTATQLYSALYRTLRPYNTV